MPFIPVKVNYLDRTRYPKLVDPIEQQFKENHNHVTKEMLKALAEKMVSFTKPLD